MLFITAFITRPFPDQIKEVERVKETMYLEAT